MTKRFLTVLGVLVLGPIVWPMIMIGLIIASLFVSSPKKEGEHPADVVGW